jgi:hypothetical protein
MERGPKVPTKNRKDADSVDCHYVHVCLLYHNLVVEFAPQVKIIEKAADAVNCC